jgi:hypothetical protein
VTVSDRQCPCAAPCDTGPGRTEPHRLSAFKADHDDGRLSIAMPIRLEGTVLGCINLTWRMKVMTVAEMTRRHLDGLRGEVSAVERRVSEVSRSLWDRVGVDEA